MATPINHKMVKQLRDERGWTQEELAKRAGLNKQSIFRIEKGEYRGTRRETIAQLCKAFEVDVATITGRPSNQLAPEAGDAGPLGTASQLNLRIDNAARNALALTARRYSVQLSEIVEIAPLLFVIAAERSLQKRRKNLGRVNEALGEVEALRDKHRYLLIDIPGNEDSFNIEEKSIEANDIFGRIFDNEKNRRFCYAHDFDHNVDNPFASFIKEDLQDIENSIKETGGKPVVRKFYGWHPDVWSTPGYQICIKEAVDLVGRDEGAVRAIVNGQAPLHEIPKELRNSSPEQLAEWAKKMAKDREVKLEDL